MVAVRVQKVVISAQYEAAGPREHQLPTGKEEKVQSIKLSESQSEPVQIITDVPGQG